MRMGVFGLITGRWVHSSAHWVSFGLSGVDFFTRVRLEVHWVNPGSLCPLGCTLGVVGFIRGS